MNIVEIISDASPDPSGPSMPYVIAEAGVNHEGKMDLAKRLIAEAREGGADAIKFQTYRAGTIASKQSPSYWDLSKEPTTSQYQLFKKYDKFWKKEFEELKTVCDAGGIEFMSTPFDTESATFLADLMPLFKISSSDITNKPFIEFMCDFNKPILLSAGASEVWEIARAVSWIEGKGNALGLMHCVLNYPTADENANLGMILDMKRRFPGHVIGYSDHTLPRDMKVLELAVLLGARILEKHFTFDKNLPGNDHYHAMDRDDLRKFRVTMERDFTVVGSVVKKALASESPARANARRSLVSSRAIPAGTVISAADLTWKRPASGISPAEIETVIGMKAVLDIPEDTPLTWGSIQ